MNAQNMMIQFFRQLTFAEVQTQCQTFPPERAEQRSHRVTFCLEKHCQKQPCSLLWFPQQQPPDVKRNILQHFAR